jgi:hypothetical protein
MFRTLATLGLAAATGNALAMRVQQSLEPSSGPVNEWLLHQFHMVTGNHRNHGRTTCQTAQASAQ